MASNAILAIVPLLNSLDPIGYDKRDHSLLTPIINNIKRMSRKMLMEHNILAHAIYTGNYQIIKSVVNRAKDLGILPKVLNNTTYSKLWEKYNRYRGGPILYGYLKSNPNSIYLKKILKFLLENGASAKEFYIGSKVYSPLMAYLSKTQHPKKSIIHMLISYGANVNMPTEDSRGKPPIDDLIDSMDHDLATILYKAGANPPKNKSDWCSFYSSTSVLDKNWNKYLKWCKNSKDHRLVKHECNDGYVPGFHDESYSRPIFMCKRAGARSLKSQILSQIPKYKNVYTESTTLPPLLTKTSTSPYTDFLDYSRIGSSNKKYKTYH